MCDECQKKQQTIDEQAARLRQYEDQMLRMSRSADKLLVRPAAREVVTDYTTTGRKSLVSIIK